MTDHPGGIRWPLLLVGGVCLVGIGVAVGYRLRPDAPAPTMASPAELIARSSMIGQEPRQATSGVHDPALVR